MKDLFQLSSKKISNDSVKIKTDNNENAIAIIGISLKFPMSETLNEFWNIIENGTDCIKELGDNRKSDIKSYMSQLGYEKVDLVEMGSIKEIDKFDYNFFGYTPKEAEHIDPGQRLFLEVAYSAMEDAGYGGDALRGSNTGVYVGYAGDSSYKQILNLSKDNNAALNVIGNMPSLIGSRVAHIFDFHGPNMTLNTTCSSALVALNYACQDIREKRCNMAIVGCSSLVFFPQKGLRGLGIESPTYRTRAFDANADGTGAGEGVAAIIVKGLEDAKRDKDNIYAVIKGIAVNHDGNSIGITAPNPEAQEEVISRAIKYSGINPESIGYFEAHGTGTKLGDPIEIKGITRAFAKFTSKKQFIPIGSVKTNIGHTFISSGMASLIKSVLLLKKKIIPGLINYSEPNPEIDFTESPVYINTQNKEWLSDGNPRRCSISSFGLSGTNAHVIIEEFDYQREYKKTQDYCGIFTLSTKSKSGLYELLEKYDEFLSDNQDTSIESLCYTSNVGRGHYSTRVAIICNSIDDLLNKIQMILRNEHEQFKSNDIYLDDIGNKELEKQISKNVYMNCSFNKNYIEKLRDICNDYVNGMDINWNQFYSVNTNRRISLPTYPFDKNRCWVKIENNGYYDNSNKQMDKEKLKNNLNVILKKQMQIIQQQKALIETSR